VQWRFLREGREVEQALISFAEKLNMFKPAVWKRFLKRDSPPRFYKRLVERNLWVEEKASPLHIVTSSLQRLIHSSSIGDTNSRLNPLE
jgi:hypothetical protein